MHPNILLFIITILFNCFTTTFSAPIQGKRPTPLQASKGHDVPPKTVGDAWKNGEIHDPKGLGFHRDKFSVNLDTGKVTRTVHPFTHEEMAERLNVPWHEALLGNKHQSHQSTLKPVRMASTDPRIVSSSKKAEGNVKVLHLDPETRTFTARTKKSGPLSKEESDSLHASLSNHLKAVKAPTKAVHPKADLHSQSSSPRKP